MQSNGTVVGECRIWRRESLLTLIQGLTGAFFFIVTLPPLSLAQSTEYDATEPASSDNEPRPDLVNLFILPSDATFYPNLEEMAEKLCQMIEKRGVPPLRNRTTSLHMLSVDCRIVHFESGMKITNANDIIIRMHHIEFAEIIVLTIIAGGYIEAPILDFIPRKNYSDKELVYHLNFVSRYVLNGDSIREPGR